MHCHRNYNMGRFQYTGQTWYGELGLYSYKACMYSPTLGRFMQTDPIGYGDGMNWYDYVKGDPVNKVDPSGLYDDCSGGADDIAVCGSRPSIIMNLAPLIFGGGGGFGDGFGAGLGGGGGGGGTSDDLGCITASCPKDEDDPEASRTDVIDEIVVTARKTRTLSGVRINLNLPYPLEQLWVVTSDGQIVHVPTIAMMSEDSCGNTLGANTPASAVPNDVSALIHTHPNWGNAWPGAGDYTSAQRYDVYNINKGGTWVLRQGAARGSAPTTLSGRAPAVPSSGGGATCR